MNEQDQKKYLEILILQNQLIIDQNQLLVADLSKRTTLITERVYDFYRREKELDEIVASLLQKDSQERKM